MFRDHVVEVLDEMPGKFLFVGLIGYERLPRLTEFVAESGQHGQSAMQKEQR